MSDRGDHHVEMPSPVPDDSAVEAFLSGRPLGAAELAPLATFAEDLRVTVDRGVPVPNAALATLLTDGIPTRTGAALAGSSSRREVQGASAPNRRRKFVLVELLAALAAKLTGLGMAAKAALGLGVTAASISTAGVAGILPDPAQHAVAKVVSAATPFELSDSDAAGTDTGGADDVEGVPDDSDVTDAGRADNHGACVSEVAKNAPRGPHGEHGRAVSTAARSDCGKDSTSTSTSSTSSTSTSSTTSTTLDDTASVDDNRGRGGPGSNGGGGNSGNGNSGNGNGNSGNSGPGNSGSAGSQGSGRSGKSG